MMTKLSEDLRQAVADQGEAPLFLVDDSTQCRYVLLRAEQYEKIKALLDEEFDPRSTYPAIDQTMREGWDDPAMDIYDDYDAHGLRS
jgi:predicted ATPase